ncbi:hypothetical protein Lal_00021144 [Lupinus albus]|nr:hypothetical protein Lal_00021144 [Lupinus albus]
MDLPSIKQDQVMYKPMTLLLVNSATPGCDRVHDNQNGYNFGARHYNETNYNEARSSPSHTHLLQVRGQFSSTTFHVLSEQGTSMRYTFHSRHNSARNFRADRRMIASQLPTPTSCTWCNARMFHHETQNIGIHFRQHIRGYNHIFAFTSLGVHLDNTLAATGRGIYTFRAPGSIYHNIGGLHPNEEDRPLFMQLYI